MNHFFEEFCCYGSVSDWFKEIEKCSTTKYYISRKLNDLGSKILPAMIVEFAIQIFRAVQFLNRIFVIHNSLLLENIMVTPMDNKILYKVSNYSRSTIDKVI